MTGLTVVMACAAFAGAAPPAAAQGGNVPFSPYIDVTNDTKSVTIDGEKLSYADYAIRAGLKRVTLAFVRGAGQYPGGVTCEPTWAGKDGTVGNGYLKSEINGLQNAGVTVTASFGGANGNMLAEECGSADDLANAYRKVRDVYGITNFDFDIEGNNDHGNALRVEALKKVQSDQKKLILSLTLASSPGNAQYAGGVNNIGIKVIKDFKDAGLETSYNLMVMDYGQWFYDTWNYDLAKMAIDSVDYFVTRQLPQFYNADDESARYARVVAIPHIGKNFATAPGAKPAVFALDDARKLIEHAQGKGMGGLSMWSVLKDQPCVGRGPEDPVQTNCHQLNEIGNPQPLSFAKLFSDVDTPGAPGITWLPIIPGAPVIPSMPGVRTGSASSGRSRARSTPTPAAGCIRGSSDK
ncbi:glycosyl hydrolase family 18 protein [Nocardia vinacea]|uniref:glycosyl hydrolase family 18 protein n=1 Tax=Nocardia vinacea TaxID=96468 RepID=UPI002E30A3F9|nr:glycosyl hydrolase family 18 protein [Nocardia vinacea]